MLLRVLGFVAAFVLGVHATSLGSWVNTNFTIPTDISVQSIEIRERTEARPAIGVYVMYAGVQRDLGDGPYLRFIVHNGTPDAIKYHGDGPEFPFVQVAADGRYLGTNFCSWASTDYSIEPGKTTELLVGVHEFASVPIKSKPVTVGIYIHRKYSNGSELFDAEPFLLPDEFRSAIAEHLRDQYQSR